MKRKCGCPKGESTPGELRRTVWVKKKKVTRIQGLRWKKHVLLAVFVSFKSLLLLGQPTRAPKKFSSSVLHTRFTDVVRDSDNFIWVSSFGAVERYDGLEARKIEGNGYHEMAYRLFVDANNRVWTVDLGSGFSYIEGDSTVLYEHNDQIKHLSDNGVLRSMSFDKEGSIHLSADYHGYFRMDSLGALTKVLDASEGLSGWVYVENSEGVGHSFFAYDPNHQKGNVFNFYVFDEDDLRFSVPVEVDAETKSMLTRKGIKGHMTKDVIGNYVFSFGGPNIYKVSGVGESEKFTLDHSVYEIFTDSKGEYWISNVEGSVYHYPRNGLGSIDMRRIYFQGVNGPNRTVVRCEDHEQGIWIARGELGVFQIPDRRHGVYDEASGHLMSKRSMAIARANDDIVVGLRGNGTLTIINSKTQKAVLHKRLNGYYSKTQCSALAFDSVKNRLWAGSNGMFGYYNYPIATDQLPEKVYPIHSHCYGIVQKENSKVTCALAAKSFTLLDDTSIVYRSDTFKKLLISVCFTHDDKLVIGSRGDGVRIVDFDSNYEASITHIPSLNVASVASAFNKTWLVVDKELYTLNEEYELEPFKVDPNNQVGVSAVYTFNGNLWVSFGRGIYRLRERADGNGYEVDVFPYDTGLPSLSKPGNLTIYKKKIYIAGVGGIPVYDFKGLESFSRFDAPMVDRVVMNGRALPRKNSYTLSYKENSMNVELSAPHYKYGFQRFFRYKLKLLRNDTEDASWVELNKPGLNTVNFSHLSPGNYELHAQIGASSLPWSESMVMGLEILPPYWQTWWFRSVMLLLLMAIIWQAASYRHRNKRRQLQLELDAMTAHQKALRAQINPHFVFNVIASVQYLVKSSPPKASKFLGHFASLIRKALDHSFEQWVPLESELDQLENYLALEQMRLDGNFEYHIDSEGLHKPESLLIPPALVQPYIENAVWHGLKTKDGDGLLKVKFHSDQSHLKVTIEDNGPGRVNSEGTGNHKGSKSHGMLLSAERIKTLNAEQGSFASVALSDIENGTGTRVEIQLKARFVDESTVSR